MAQRTRRSLRAALAALTSVLLLPLGAGVAAAAPDAGPAPGAAERKIEPELRAQFDGSDKAVFLGLQVVPDVFGVPVRPVQ